MAEGRKSTVGMGGMQAGDPGKSVGPVLEAVSLLPGSQSFFLLRPQPLGWVAPSPSSSSVEGNLLYYFSPSHLRM